MEIFLDTANIEEIKEILSWGVMRGLTTNQKIFLNEKGVNFETQVKKILDLVAHPVALAGYAPDEAEGFLVGEDGMIGHERDGDVASDFRRLNEGEVLVVLVDMHGARTLDEGIALLLVSVIVGRPGAGVVLVEGVAGHELVGFLAHVEHEEDFLSVQDSDAGGIGDYFLVAHEPDGMDVFGEGPVQIDEGIAALVFPDEVFGALGDV